MIKLELPDKPLALTDALEKTLVDQFKKNNQDPVWKKEFIREAVFKISNGKCAYSEVLLDEEGKDMQIDHFYPKSKYPDKVVEWGNLLPSLNHCNRKKSDADPNIKELVNPLIDNPKDYFYFHEGHLFPINDKGRNTINTFDLDNYKRLCTPRYRYVKRVKDDLNDISLFLENNIDYFRKRLKEIMSNGNRRETYSAAVSTSILSNGVYLDYKNKLTDLNLWDDEFILLEKELIFCSLPKP